MSKTIKFGFDIDDVLHDFVGSFIPYLNKHTRKTLDISHVDNWVMENIWNIDTSTFRNLIKNSNLYVDNAFYAGVRELLTTIKDDGHEVHLITSRFTYPDFNTEEATLQWLNKHGIPFDSLHFSSEKGNICATIGIDCFVDDSIANISKIQKDSPKTHTILRSRNWNGEVELNRLLSNGKLTEEDVAKIRNTDRIEHILEITKHYPIKLKKV